MVLDIVEKMGKKDGINFLVEQFQEHGLHFDYKHIQVRVNRLNQKHKGRTGESWEEIMASTFKLSTTTQPDDVIPGIPWYVLFLLFVRCKMQVLENLATVSQYFFSVFAKICIYGVLIFALSHCSRFFPFT